MCISWIGIKMVLHVKAKMAKRTKKFPSKQEIINTLLKEDQPAKKFEKLILIIEHKKVSNEIGYIKGELIQNGRLLGKGAITCLPKKEKDSFDWNMLDIGQSYFNGFSLDYRAERITALITEGLKKSMKEGKIPFLPRF